MPRGDLPDWSGRKRSAVRRGTSAGTSSTTTRTTCSHCSRRERSCTTSRGTTIPSPTAGIPTRATGQALDSGRATTMSFTWTSYYELDDEEFAARRRRASAHDGQQPVAAAERPQLTTDDCRLKTYDRRSPQCEPSRSRDSALPRGRSRWRPALRPRSERRSGVRGLGAERGRDLHHGLRVHEPELRGDPSYRGRTDQLLRARTAGPGDSPPASTRVGSSSSFASRCLRTGGTQTWSGR